MTLRDRKFIASLEALFHSLTTLIVKNTHLVSNLNCSALTFSHYHFSLCLSISRSEILPVFQCCNEVLSQRFYFILLLLLLLRLGFFN